jgi:hypothetical protein
VVLTDELIDLPGELLGKIADQEQLGRTDQDLMILFVKASG